MSDRGVDDDRLDTHPELPLDPDVDAAEVSTGTTGTAGTATPQPRPVHRSPAAIALVAAGGALGTGLRLLLEQTVPRWGDVPVVTVAINVIGAFLLGVLLEAVASPALDERWSRRARLGLGTGVLGGFTTYSSLANDTAVLAVDHLGRAAAYASITVLVGLAASLAGIRVTRAGLRRGRPDAGNQP